MSGIIELVQRAQTFDDLNVALEKVLTSLEKGEITKEEAKEISKIASKKIKVVGQKLSKLKKEGVDIKNINLDDIFVD